MKPRNHRQRRRKQPLLPLASSPTSVFRNHRHFRKSSLGCSSIRFCCCILFNGVLLSILGGLCYFGSLDLIKLTKNKHRARPPVERVWRNPLERDQNQPIMVVGLPKAGTSSLFEFFHCHGFYAQHWYCCHRQDRADTPGSVVGPRGPSYMSHCLMQNLKSKSSANILDGCGDYDIYTEMNGPKLPTRDSQTPPGIFLPQHYHLQELHEAEPTATWILNIRPVDEWIRSVLNVPAQKLLEQLKEEVEMHNTMRNGTIAREQFNRPVAGTRRDQDIQFLKEFWEDHIDHVQAFIKEHPTHQLIEIDISSPAVGVDLAKSLWKNQSMSLDKAKFCWKKYNMGEYDH